MGFMTKLNDNDEDIEAELAEDDGIFNDDEIDSLKYDQEQKSKEDSEGDDDIFGDETPSTTVKASNSDISDNLDLRAVATIFGDASNLEDFERRLNDPKTQISNLDLNNDNYVDNRNFLNNSTNNPNFYMGKGKEGINPNSERMNEINNIN